MLRERTLSDKDVISFLKSFVLVKVDAWADGKDEAAKYKVQGIPQTVIFDAEGKEIGRKVGYMEPTDFIDALTSIRDSDTNLEEGKKKVEADASDPAGYMQMAKGYLGKGEAEKAKENLEKVVELDPKNEKEVGAKAYETLANLYAETRRFDKAVETAQKLAELDPENKQGLALKATVLLSSYYRALRNEEKFVEHHKKIVELDPENKGGEGLTAAFELGQYYIGKADKENATKYFDAVRKMDPEDKENYADMMDLALLAGIPSTQQKWGEAIEGAKKFIETHKESELLPRAYLILGAFHLRNDEKDKAIEVFEELIVKFPDSTEAERVKRELPRLKQ